MGAKRDDDDLNYTDARTWADRQEQGGTLTSLQLPSEARMFNIKKEGSYRVDILPYRVGKGNPNADEGSLHYERTYFVHKGIGLEERSYTCPLKTCGKPCPICEHVAKLRRDPSADEDVIKSLKPQIRMIWNLVDLNDRDAGVQVWDTAYFKSFGEMLKDKIQSSDEEDDYHLFFRLDKGLTLKLFVQKDSFNGRSFNRVATIDFKPRAEPYDKSILKETFCLDDCIKVLSYDELKAIFLQQPGGDREEDADPKSHHRNGDAKSSGTKGSSTTRGGEDDDDERPSAKTSTRGKPSADDDIDSDTDRSGDEPPSVKVGDMVRHRKYGLCEITHISRDGTSLKIKDEDGDVHAPVSIEDVAPSKGKKSAPPDDEDEPPAKKKPAPPKDLKALIGERVQHPKLGECQVIKVSKDGETVVIEDEDGNMHAGIDPDVLDAIVDEPPVKKASKSEDDEDEDEPAPKKRSGKDDDFDDFDEPKKKPAAGKRR